MMTDLQHFQLGEGTSTLKTFEVVAGIPFGGTLHIFGHRYGNFAEYYQAGMASPALTIDRDIDLLLRRQNKMLIEFARGLLILRLADKRCWVPPNGIQAYVRGSSAKDCRCLRSVNS
jgi:hypothetical protein